MSNPAKPARARRVVLSCAVLLLSSACVTQSIHPIYDERTLTFDERLLGVWSDGDARWAFTAAEPLEYTLIHTEEGESAAIEVDAHLARLGENIFLDLYSEKPPEELGDLFEVLNLPLHTVFRVDEMDDTLILSGFRINWIEQYLQENPEAAPHTFVDGRAVLTGDTESVQSFFAAHATDPSAWEVAIEMRRQPGDRTGAPGS